MILVLVENLGQNRCNELVAPTATDEKIASNTVARKGIFMVISVVVPELLASLPSQYSFQPKGLPDFLEITGILV